MTCCTPVPAKPAFPAPYHTALALAVDDVAHASGIGRRLNTGYLRDKAKLLLAICDTYDEREAATVPAARKEAA